LRPRRWQEDHALLCARIQTLTNIDEHLVQRDPMLRSVAEGRVLAVMVDWLVHISGTVYSGHDAVELPPESARASKAEAGPAGPLSQAGMQTNVVLQWWALGLLLISLQ
jgi:hypothetical protein